MKPLMITLNGYVWSNDSAVTLNSLAWFQILIFMSESIKKGYEQKTLICKMYDDDIDLK